MSGSASLDLERLLLEHTLAIAPMPTLSRVYVALCRTAPSEAVGGVELAGGGYARSAATFTLLASPANAAANATAVEFTPATSDWGTVSWFEIWTQPTGGTRLYWGQLVDPADGVPIEIDVPAGSVARFSPGTLVVQAADMDPMVGAPWLPLTGGEMTGPLIYTATGGNTPRSAQDRAADFHQAVDLGVICDGVTDQGAQLNAALNAIPPGSTLFIPSSVYTTQTIVLTLGRKLEMPPGSMIRPVAGSTRLVGTIAIIGSASLSPVVQVVGNEGGLVNVWITRNGTPAAGSIGLQCSGQDQLYTKCRFYNHAVGTRCGGNAANPPNTVSITTAFDHCQWWNCTENFTYLLNAPETSFYDCRWGLNGSTDPAGATSLITVDGDNNTSAGGTNTLTFLRCQFNTGGGPLYSVRFRNVNLQGVYKFIGCYSGGAQTAFCFIDPSCAFVQGLTFLACTFQPLSAGETFIIDTNRALNGLKVIGCEFGPITPASFTLSGIGATIVGNTWYGGAIVTLDAMGGGSFVGNSLNTLQVTGVVTNSFIVASNAIVNITQTATGPVSYIQPTGVYGSQLTLGKTGQAGRVDFRRGTDGILTSYVGIAGAGGGSITEIANSGGSPTVRMNANNTGGVNAFLVNSVEVARLDVLGLGMAKSTTAAAPGAASARLAFVAGTTAGTAKLVAYAGTSATPVTIIDNIGTGF